MAWIIDKYKVKIRLSQPMLGTIPEQKSIFAAHIATKQRKQLKREGMTDTDIEAELERTIEGVGDNDAALQGKTTFYKDARGYYIRNYMLRGFFKSAATALKQDGALKQLASKVSKYVFVAGDEREPEKIYVALPEANLELVERPLRAQTPMGERVAIARSDSLPAGTEIEFTVSLLQEVVSERLLRTLLEYGQFIGLGQWRSSSAGSFSVVSFEAL